MWGGYNHACADSHDHSRSLVSLKHMHLNNTRWSTGAFADDLICLAGSLRNLHIQADKLTRYSNWAALQVSGSKTKVTGFLHGAAKTGVWGKDPKKHLRAQLSNKIHVQGQHARFIEQDDPFTYLGVELIMSQNWTHQYTRMTNLETKTHRPQKPIRLPLAGHTHYKYRNNHAKHSVCISGHCLRPWPTKRLGQ